jgi:glycosyltransferase involved in cell wall biosynthesis
MSKVSVLIPSRGEQFLPQTVADILAHAGGDVEVIAALDGYWPNPPLPEDKRLKIVHHGTPLGMRASINHAAAVATGDYLMKCDGHCMFAEGFDEVLKADIQDNQIVIPRRKRLDAENWAIQDVGKPDIDLHYLSNPMTNPDGFSMHGAIWPREDRKRLDILIDETPSFQGSFWMMTRAHWERLGGMSEEGYGGFTQEPQEIGMKTWLGGGQVVVNKKTWYAHLHKGKKFGRGYHQDRREIIEGHEYSARYWMNNKWTERVHDFEWFIDKFPNMPTWDANWKEEWNKHEYNEHR